MPPPVRITVKPHGTLHVQGPVEIVDSEGNPIVPPPGKVPGLVKFCGCGRSGTKPFCDGSHKQCAPPEQAAS